jgi:hypothetical protein
MADLSPPLTCACPTVCGCTSACDNYFVANNRALLRRAEGSWAYSALVSDVTMKTILTAYKAQQRTQRLLSLVPRRRKRHDGTEVIKGPRAPIARGPHLGQVQGTIEHRKKSGIVLAYAARRHAPRAEPPDLASKIRNLQKQRDQRDDSNEQN